jgi:hypothetical protein
MEKRDQLGSYDHSVEQSKTQTPTKVEREPAEPIKIKYISSPVFVNASNAYEFRAIVQELTGQNSKLVTDGNPQ